MKEKRSDVKEMVREGYGKIARHSCSCCCGDESGDINRKIGYTDEQLGGVPCEANLGLGCGNPTALASISPGEAVLDLGSGAGVDCFLAASRVGPEGRVIGVDMTPAMIERATRIAREHGFQNVEFRLGEIEQLPVEDGSVDRVISNCVINLSPDKAQVFREAFRVLQPGGSLFISDLVLVGELPERVKHSAAAYVGCLSGAVRKEEYLRMIEEAGFSRVVVADEKLFPLDCLHDDETANVLLEDPTYSAEETKEISDAVRSIMVTAWKPGPGE
ncbi:MAG: arsenite methyltransferase [Methanomicrobiaceae archaeon]|nr:arsenite methyltransferase [Methanomicrobiaceae archaeon]